jgi:hypothetical protein
MYTPIRISTARGPLKEYVTPVSRATAIVAVRPGSIPKIRPRRTEINREIRPAGETTTSSAVTI